MEKKLNKTLQKYKKYLSIQSTANTKEIFETIRRQLYIKLSQLHKFKKNYE